MTFFFGFIAGAFWGRRGGRFKSREALRQWQERRLRRQLAFVRRASPYYRSVLMNDDFGSYPVMDKATLMSHFDTINTAGLSKDQAFAVAHRAETTREFAPRLNGYTVGLSSGTSHRRGLFAVSDYERGFWAAYILRRMLPRGL